VGALPLAQGELDAEAAAELRVLKEQILRAVGFRCDSYKEKCLRRRIAVRMRARGMHTYADYALLLRADPAEYERLVDTITINVSKFFRNPEVWDAVRAQVLPALHAQGHEVLRVWSAGCASGEEPYSLNILLREYAAARSVPPAHTVLGTDIDVAVLEQAERGEYPAFALADTQVAVRDRWFGEGPPYRLQPEARQGVSFQRLDLLSDPLPRDQHLICCRNVVIYFERPLQETLFQRLHASLAPGGFLVLGKVEALSGSAGRLFSMVSARHRIFRRHDPPALA